MHPGLTGRRLTRFASMVVGLTFQPMSGRRLPVAVRNERLSSQLSREVLLIDAESVRSGDVLELSIRETNADWRQGVWLGAEGLLSCAGTTASQLTIWADTAPAVTSIEVLETTDGLLRVYNVWASGRPGSGSHESQAATSGMLKEPELDDVTVYRSQDIGLYADFSKIVFALRKRSPGGH